MFLWNVLTSNTIIGDHEGKGDSPGVSGEASSGKIFPFRNTLNFGSVMKAIFFAAELFFLAGCQLASPVLPPSPFASSTSTEATTQTQTPTLPNIPTKTSTHTAISTATSFPGINFNGSSLVATFLKSLTEGEIASCDLVSPSYTTPDITVGANVYMSNGTPAQNLPVVMVRSDKAGNLLYNPDGSFIVLGSGTLVYSEQPVAYTHTAIFDGFSITDINGNLYPDFHYQIRVRNRDGTLDGQVGGLPANCSINMEYREPATPTPLPDEGGSGGGKPKPTGEPTDPPPPPTIEPTPHG
jgi:hypothetical protein